MEMSCGILDHKLGEEHAENLNDVKEELRDISAMVNELLSFSKAAVGMDSMMPEPVSATRRDRRSVAHRGPARRSGVGGNLRHPDRARTLRPY